MVEVTKDEAYAINELGNLEAMSNQTASNSKTSELAIMNVKKPLLNSETREVKFFI